jgi:S-DNA-T family DNA segregation ATPase FtsK/SpoIIIE
LARIDWPAGGDLSQPPDRVSLSDVLGGAAEELPIECWWDNGSPFGFLRAPIGRTSATADFVFDLRDQDGAHGPHGLVGGMTGSGKSEVLKSILLALAATHHPHDLNFILIDYKGGAAFNELEQLPHTVGVVTDIESHASYAERILAALSGEVERRKRLLEQARISFHFARTHVDEYRALRVRQPLPHLVVVFDEFAEFKSRHPEESKRLISIARLGRSLGVHLILATQNIQAAIDPQILQNSTFRICLKVSQPEDSLQMVGCADALSLPRGRAIFQAQGRTTVQIAYSGGTVSQTPKSAHPAEWILIRRNGNRETLPAQWTTAPGGNAEMTEAHALVDRIRQAASSMHLPMPSAVWHDPLPEKLFLPKLIREYVSGGWDGAQWIACRRLDRTGEAQTRPEPILGMADLPERQTQPLLDMASGGGGDHLLAFGSAGSGKTTLIRTLVTSIAWQVSPAGAQVYILDGGGQAALKPLAEFPHVGAVVSLREAERAQRLIAFLRRESLRRSELFRRAGVDTRLDYNRQHGVNGELPEIYFLLDGLLEVKRAYPPEFLHALTSLLNGSAAVGIRIILTANQQGDVPGDLFSNIGFRVTFHQTNPAEYAGLAGMPCEVRIQEEAGSVPVPGRGLARGKPPVDWQAALPAEGWTEMEQAAGFSELARTMRAAWNGTLTASVQDLPAHVDLRGLAKNTRPAGTLFAPLGLNFDTLEPVGFSLTGDGPTFLVAGATPQCGKTALLQTWLLGLMDRYTPERVRFTLVDFHARTLRSFRRCAHTEAYVDQASGVEDSLRNLLSECERRAEAAERAYREDPDGFDRIRWLEQLPVHVVVIDDYDKFAAMCENGSRLLADCVARGGELGIFVLAAGNAAELPRDYDDPLMQKMRRNGCGVLLNGAQELDQFNNARPPAGFRAEGMPAGRGFLVRRGCANLFQAAAFWEPDSSPKDSLAGMRELKA